MPNSESGKMGNIVAGCDVGSTTGKVVILNDNEILSHSIVGSTPKVERFTEFYVLGISGKATDYPKELVVGKEAEVILGIINREYEPVTYRVEVVISGVKNNEVGPVLLEHNEEWNERAAITPYRVGDNQTLEFLLYRQGQSKVYQRLNLWVDVQ